MSMSYTLTEIVDVEFTGRTERVYDIEVDHPDHAFIAKSSNRSHWDIA